MRGQRIDSFFEPKAIYSQVQTGGELSGEKDCVGGKGEGHMSVCLFKESAASCNRVEGWSLRALVAIAAEMVGARGVERDEKKTRLARLCISGCSACRDRQRQDNKKLRRESP